MSKVECTFQSGQVPPNLENGKVPEENVSRRCRRCRRAAWRERHAACVRPLQGGEAVADLLEAGVEALRQHVDVVIRN